MFIKKAPTRLFITALFLLGALRKKQLRCSPRYKWSTVFVIKENKSDINKSQSQYVGWEIFRQKGIPMLQLYLYKSKNRKY